MNPTTPDGRYFVVRGRMWRCSDPALDEDERQRLVNELMDARRAAKAPKASDDSSEKGEGSDAPSQRSVYGASTKGMHYRYPRALSRGRRLSQGQWNVTCINRYASDQCVRPVPRRA